MDFQRVVHSVRNRMDVLFGTILMIYTELSLKDAPGERFASCIFCEYIVFSITYCVEWENFASQNVITFIGGSSELD